MTLIRILITDDHPVVREGLTGMLVGQPDFDVVGLAADVREAVSLHQETAPDVTLMDLRMPDLDGVSAIQAIEAGATGYLLKDAPREELFRAIRAAAGNSVLAPSVAARLMTRMGASADDSLSAREIEVLKLVAKRNSNKDVGKALHISTATVKTHLIHIYNKLGVADRTAAVTTALEKGIIALAQDT